MKKLVILILFFSCAKGPCITVVNAAFNEAGTEAAATKGVNCDCMPATVATKLGALRFIEVNFFQGARVVRADVIYKSDFVGGIFKRQYEFSDTNPNLMTWKVYDDDRPGFVQYETPIK